MVKAPQKQLKVLMMMTAPQRRKMIQWVFQEKVPLQIHLAKVPLQMRQWLWKEMISVAAMCW
jgi:hypothetical protein